MKEAQQAIVLGMHRSGTSLVANILTTAGFDMGDSLIAGGISNVDGHYEDENLVSINDGLLHFLEASWKSPPSFEKIQQDGRKFLSTYAEYTQKRSAKSLLWGAKDPRTSLTAPLLYPNLSNPYFIVCYRSADKVADSLFDRNQIPVPQGKKLKLLYDNSIENFFGCFPEARRLDVNYEDLVNDPETTIENIFAFLNISPTSTIISLSVDKVRPPESLRSAKMEHVDHEYRKLLNKMREKPYVILKKSYWRKLLRTRELKKSLLNASRHSD